MPMHDWTKAEPGNYHGFHQLWIARISDLLNLSALPPDHYALIEKNGFRDNADHFKQVADSRNIAEHYASIANRVVVKREDHEIVSIVEIVSPGNKAKRSSFNGFVSNCVRWIKGGMHMLLIDPFPPATGGARDLHSAIWSELNPEYEPDRDFKLERNMASYEAGESLAAYIEPLKIGDPFPDMPLFVRPGVYVNLPIEMTYLETWKVYPKAVKRDVE